MRPLPVLGSLLAAALGAATVVLWSGHADLEGRLRALEESPAPAARAPDPARAPAESRSAGPVLEGPSVPLSAFESLAERVEALRTRVESPPAPEAEGGLAPEDARFEESVRGVVERMLEDPAFRPRLAQAAREGGIGKKPRFDELARALGLDVGQAQRLRDDLKSTQTALFEVLSLEESDGTTALAKIQAAEQHPEGDPRRAEAFVRLVQAKIPGTEETYLRRAVSLATDFRARAAEYLGPDQVERLNRLDVDLFGVKLD